MLRFGPSESERPPRSARAPGRVWSLVLMLLLAMALLLGAWRAAGRFARQESMPADKSGTATITARPPDNADRAERLTAEAVELDRISQFQDHTRAIDSDPYYYLLDLARRNPAQWMEERARRDVTWAHLLRDPDKYRGQLILLRGRLRRLTEEDVDPNPYDIRKRYEGWLYTDEGGQFPYAVVLSDPPTGMPQGLINERVIVAAYFLGWYRYTTQEGRAHAAPILLGRRLRWLTEPIERPDSALSSTYGLAVGIAIAAAGLITAYTTFRRVTRPAESRRVESAEPLVFEERMNGEESK